MKEKTKLHALPAIANPQCLPSMALTFGNQSPQCPLAKTPNGSEVHDLAVEAWTLNVMLISGKKLQSFKVDEHTKFTEIYDGIPKTNYMSVKLLAKTKILPEKDVTFREFKLVGVTELTAVFSHKNKFCPRCRSFQRARHNLDKFARLMKHDYENNPTHHIGLQLPKL